MPISNFLNILKNKNSIKKTTIPNLSVDTLVAHRGLQKDYPENTLLSIKKAIDAGVKFIEIDIQFSKDKLPIICHDDNLNRLGGIKNFQIKERNQSEIIKQPAHEPQRFGDRYIGEKISPLEAIIPLLVLHPEITIFIEIKEETIKKDDFKKVSSDLILMLDEVIDQVVLISFNSELIKIISESLEVSTGLILSSWDDITHKTKIIFNCDYIFIDHELIPARYNFSKSPIKPNCKIVCYEVDDINLGKDLLAAGIDLIETFQYKKLSKAKSFAT